MLIVIVLSPLAAVCQALADSPTPQRSLAASDSGTSAAVLPQAPSGLSSSTAALPEPAASQSAQSAPPVNPGPPNGAWRKIQRLVHGEPIVVSSTYGPSMACRFAGATEDALFCDAQGAPDGSGYRFERATVISVRAERAKRNYHPFLIGSMIAVGTVVGVRVASNADAGSGAGAGVLAAVMTGGIGALSANPQLLSPGWR